MQPLRHFFRRSDSLVGLDIGSSAVKAVELAADGEGCEVAAIGSAPVSFGSLVDGVIVDPGAVAGAITRALDTGRIRGRRVAASLSRHAVIVKRLAVPFMDRAELAASIGSEAQRHIPFDIEDVNLDYHVLEPDAGAAEHGALDVMLVAAKKETIARYIEVIGAVGCTPAVIDVGACALQNAYVFNHGVAGRSAALLDVGASAVTVNIVHRGQPVFTRDIAAGGIACTEALRRELDLTFEDAERVKRHLPVPGCRFDDADAVVHAVGEELLIELQKTFDFYAADAGDVRIDHIVLTGGASAASGFEAACGRRFEATVERLDPFRRVAFPAALAGEELRSEMAGSAAVAVGLALRGTGEDWNR